MHGAVEYRRVKDGEAGKIWAAGRAVGWCRAAGRDAKRQTHSCILGEIYPRSVAMSSSMAPMKVRARNGETRPKAWWRRGGGCRERAQQVAAAASGNQGNGRPSFWQDPVHQLRKGIATKVTKLGYDVIIEISVPTRLAVHTRTPEVCGLALIRNCIVVDN